MRYPGSIGVPIQFPTAADFVADLPVLEIAVVGDVEHAHPISRLVAVAAAVIADDEGLGVRVGGQSNEIGRERTPASVSGAGHHVLVGPVIAVAPTAARPAQAWAAQLVHQRHGLRVVHVAVPGDLVDAKDLCIHRAHRLGGVDAQMDGGRRDRGAEGEVIQVNRWLNGTGTQMEIQTVEVGLVGNAQGNQREGDLLP